jgi:hypothetical protein
MAGAVKLQRQVLLLMAVVVVLLVTAARKLQREALLLMVVLVMSLTAWDCQLKSLPAHTAARQLLCMAACRSQAVSRQGAHPAHPGTCSISIIIISSSSRGGCRCRGRAAVAVSPSAQGFQRARRVSAPGASRMHSSRTLTTSSS